MWGRLAAEVVQGSSRGGADSRRQGLGGKEKERAACQLVAAAMPTPLFWEEMESLSPPPSTTTSYRGLQGREGGREGL